MPSAVAQALADAGARVVHIHYNGIARRVVPAAEAADELASKVLKLERKLADLEPTVARIDDRRVQLLTRTGLDWSAKYPSVIAALSSLNVKTAYIDGELCGVDAAGLPSFALTQAATDGEREATRLLRFRSLAP
jgi:hypothetical protein